MLCLWCFLHQFLQQNCLSYSPVIVHTTHCQNHLSCCIHVLIVNAIYTCTKMDECDICLKKFQSHSTKITCCICSKGYHMKCITLCPDYTQKLTEEMNNWYCPTCLSCLFPYNLITDENDFISAIADISCVSQKSFCYLSDKLFMPFELNDKDHRSALCDIDPDLHFYQEFNQATVKCNYYLETKFNDEISLLFITDISDHFPVFHIAKQMEIEEKDAYIYKRLYGSQNKDNFCHAMSNISWDEISRATDTQQAFDTFHKHLVEMYNKHFPKIRVKKKYNNRKPWLSEGLKNSIKQKNKLYLKFKKISSALNDESYKCYKRKLQQLMKVAEKQHYHDLLVEYSNDIKKSWVVIKSIINKNKKHHIQGRFKIGETLITSDKELISNKFNDFFINIGPTLAKSIPCVNKSLLSYLGNRLTESIYLAPVNENEIRQLIKSLKDTTAGFDDLNSMCLKISSRFLLKPLTHICNLSISQGIFPEQLKMANVIPLYKSDDSMSFNNYRPVSVLCVLSKIFEKIMYNRVAAFLEIFKILHDNQYGFRKKSSTHVALLTFIDKVIEAIENGEYAIGVFLDFSKAFDTVDHQILLNKLDHYGIRGCALSWFKSYLSRRLQYVTYNGSQSSQQMIKCGVPQGSILGPLLFLIYINDLCIVCKSTEPVLFADDTNLFSSGSKAISLQDGVNNDLAIIAEWLKVNKLSLNIKKTHFMCFSAKNKSRPGISLQIDGEAIAEVNKSKFLGVVIDNKLSWKDHISFVCRKVARGIGVIIKARKVLHNESLKCLYYSFMYPYMIYCNQVWGSACKTNIEPLQVLQKRAVRIILGVHPRSPSEPLFTTLKFLNCKNIFKYLIGRLMYRIYHGELHVLHGFF